MFQPRDSYWYIEKTPYGFGKYGFQGAAKFYADNPPYGVMMQVYLKQDLLNADGKRKKLDKKAGAKQAMPSWNVLDKELISADPRLWVLVQDESGQTIRRIEGPTKKGFHKIAWDLRMGAMTPLGSMRDVANLKKQGWMSGLTSQMAFPGKYTFQLVLDEGGVLTPMGTPKTVNVKRLMEPHLKVRILPISSETSTDCASYSMQLLLARLKLDGKKKSLKYGKLPSVYPKPILKSWKQPIMPFPSRY